MQCLKVKLRGNDPEWDLRRLVRVGSIAQANGVVWLSADFNCIVSEPNYVNAILDDPANQEQIATWTGVPGLVVPGRDMRNKVLRVLDVLVQQQPVKQEINGQVVELPSIQPDKELDDLDVIQKTVRQWAQKNFDKQDENPAGFRNVVLYYKMAEQYQQQKALSIQQSALSQQKQQLAIGGKDATSF